MIYLTVVASLELVVIGAVAFLWFTDRRQAEERTCAERRELLTRIQRPDLVPIPKATPPKPVAAPDPRDRIGRVGTVTLRED